MVDGGNGLTCWMHCGLRARTGQPPSPRLDQGLVCIKLAGEWLPPAWPLTAPTQPDRLLTLVIRSWRRLSIENYTWSKSHRHVLLQSPVGGPCTCHSLLAAHSVAWCCAAGGRCLAPRLEPTNPFASHRHRQHQCFVPLSGPPWPRAPCLNSSAFRRIE